jgi:transketolase
MPKTSDLQERAINTIRFLSADAVQQAESGHPGLPMGAAALAFALWTRHLRYNPRNPGWWNRDRFVLSGGHGSMLLYSLLHLTGYDVSLDEIKRFRKWGSITPGHPESHLTPGVEATTGPLGQGFGNGVGMAIAEARLAAEFNTPEHQIVEHFTFGIVTDGDLMEGVSSEAASLAGHLGLGKIIYLYDDNHVSIEGSTDLAFTEDRGARFEAYGWHVQRPQDGNDVDAVDAAIQAAKADPRPSLIICPTTIGYGLPTRAGTAKAHGEAPGNDELDGAKRKLGWPLEPRFLIPEDVLAFFRDFSRLGQELELEWHGRFDAYRAAFPERAAEFERRMTRQLPPAWDDNLPHFAADEKGMATRASSGKALNAVAQALPELFGGSADLAPSTNTLIKDEKDFEKNQYDGRNLRFGVREHGMGTIVNGLAYHGGFRPYGATFLIFTDYMRPAIRLSALAEIPSLWVMTHDSVGLGEDGPTHQPIEHLAALRAIPNLWVIRPGDANETSAAWKVAIQRTDGPVLLALTRQALPTLDLTSADDGLPPVERGAYVLADMGDGDPQLILMATGSELHVVVAAAARLASEGINVRVVSFPCWQLFEMQDLAYRESVLPPSIRARISVEAGATLGWERWVGDEGTVLGLDHFGASAPGDVTLAEFGFTVNHVYDVARKLLVL